MPCITQEFCLPLIPHLRKIMDRVVLMVAVSRKDNEICTGLDSSGRYRVQLSSCSMRSMHAFMSHSSSSVRKRTTFHPALFSCLSRPYSAAQR